MKKLAFVAAVMILSLGAASATKWPAFLVTRAARTPQPVTISVEELQRQVDVKSLPVLEIKELY